MITNINMTPINKTKKIKRIATKNLHIQLGVSTLVNFWFLWEHFSQEWFRTVLVIVYGLLVVIAIYSAVNSETVDIFKESNGNI